MNARIFLRPLCVLLGHELTADHITTRLSGGGRYTARSVVIWCTRCHRGKP